MKLATTLLLCVLLGCSMSPSEKLYIGGGLADLATTAYALENCSGAREGNPVLTLAGEDTASVIASAVLFKWIGWAFMHDKGEPFNPGLATVGILNFAVAGHNASIIDGCNTN